MKKNLKKVISAVIALALSVTSVAMAAPKFSDVAETASYAQAVEVLGALGVISGYEDGTFKPDNNITRAEVATMVVAALNRSADADGAKGTTKFDDMNVDAKTWATGFVNIGVQEGFISGYEDGSFKPDNNVTFAEMVSMLVRVAGYGRYAEYLGGWKTGYLSVGNDYGITKGVACAEDTAVTRGQVAQMIYNTLVDVPMVKSTTLTTDSNGNLVPEMTIQNGKGDTHYETLLTEKHNAYYVEGYVSETSKSSGSALDPDEVKFTVQYTENYNDSELVIKKGATEKDADTLSPTYGQVIPVERSIGSVYVGDTVATEYIMTYASAIIQIDDYDDAYFVWYAPSGKNDVVTFDATLFDEDDYKDNDTTSTDTSGNTVYNNTIWGTSAGAAVVKDKPYMRVFETKDAAKSQKYSLERNFKLYVNGVEVNATEANFETYVVNNRVGTIELIDTYKADGEYDFIFVTWYGTAKVDSVNVSNGRIGFKSGTNTDNRMNLTLDPEDDDVSYTVIYNGEEIDISALQKDDVLSIAYDVTATAPAFQNSSFYEIHVSRDKVEGKYSGKKDLDKVVTVGGKDYEYVGSYSALTGASSDFIMSNEYTLYLDVFGRIYDYEIMASAEKYAILDKVIASGTNGYDYPRAVLYTTDGVAKTLEMDLGTGKVVAPNADFDGDTVNDFAGAADVEAGWTAVVGSPKNPIAQRVVKYKVSTSSGRITSLLLQNFSDTTDNEQALNWNAPVKDEYDAYRKAIGSIVMNDATNVIDAIEYEYIRNSGSSKVPTYSDLSVGSASSFVDRTDYAVYAYGRANSDGSYPFVLVVDGDGYYTPETQIAIVTEYAGLGVDENNEEVYTLSALFDGEETDFDATDDATLVNFGYQADGVTPVTLDDSNALNEGDVIAFVQEADGKLKEITVIARAATLGLNGGYDSVWAKAMNFNAATAFATLPTSWTHDWNTYKSDDEYAVMVYGPIIDKTSSSFRIGDVQKSSVTGITMTSGVDANNDGTLDPVTAATYYADKTDKSKYKDIKITDETLVYTWDYNYAKSAQLCDSNAGAGAIIATQIGDASLYNDRTLIPFGTEAGVPNTNATTNFALAKVVDGYATEVFVILAK